MRDHRMPALRTIALVVIAVWGSTSHAAGLGPINVQSALGQPLHASVPVLGSDMAELTASCIKVTLEQPDGAPIMPVRAAVTRSGESASIQLSTRQSVNEPAVALNLQVGCGTSIQRTYQLLLDPVVILPRVQQEQNPAAVSDNNKRRLRDQAMVASPEEDAVPPASRHAVTRKSRNDRPVPASPQSQSPPPAVKPSAAPTHRKISRSVLKLSSDDVAIDTGPSFSPDLKMSDTLSESRDTGDVQSAAELKKAYGRFSAIMRDEDPEKIGEKQLKDMQARLQELEKQTAKLKTEEEQQRQADHAALESARRESFSSGWILALGGLLATALAAIGWLYWRIRSLGQQHSTALWEKTMLGQQTESAEWDNTFGVNDTFAAIDASASILTEAGPSDWERGVPLDDTLAVDWASQQASMQADTVKKAAPRKANPFDDEPEIEAASAYQTKQELSRQVGKQAQVLVQELEEMSHVALADNASAAKVAGKPVASRSAGTDFIEIEEISDLMQEAEFWMLLNDPERAIEMLQPCLHVSHPVSPVPWIYLLDLYRVTGQKENYRTLAARIKKVFNTNAPAWGAPDADTAARSLRDYPHVVQTIEDLWESDDIIPYLESLLVDERDGERAGFDLAVYREIVHLIGVARDPKAARRREQLNFDNPQSQLISQKVSLPSADAGKAAESVFSSEEADIFDRATSQQAMTRQVSAKLPKLTAVDSPLVKAATAPVLPELERHLPAQQEMEAAPAMSLAPSIPSVKEATPAVQPKIAPQATEVLSLDEATEEPDSVNGNAEDAERMADMARKLDLVLAYQEIGENVGARVLLEEVIQGGSPLQVEKAKAMLKKLLKEIDWQ